MNFIDIDLKKVLSSFEIRVNGMIYTGTSPHDILKDINSDVMDLAVFFRELKKTLFKEWREKAVGNIKILSSLKRPKMEVKKNDTKRLSRKFK